MRRLAVAAAALLVPSPAFAAGLDGSALGLASALPFGGLLLSIAILPQLAPRFWDHRLPWLSAAWMAATIVPLGLTLGAAPVAASILHAGLAEYLPFVLMLTALYTIAGGIVIGGSLRGTPALNTGLLAFGTLLASLIGTTGASMLLIRPLIRANRGRRRNAHVIVFFIFLVSNVGGALSPLGDPPLFLGFLRGVDFSWPARALWAVTGLVAALLLGIFYGLDRRLSRRDGAPRSPEGEPGSRIELRGAGNVVLLLLAVGAVALSGLWRPGWTITVLRTEITPQGLARDTVMVALTAASIVLTPRRNRVANDVSWRPITEVAIIFAAIFVCILPVSAMLATGREGAFGPLLGLVSRPDGSPIPLAYFWLTGALSSVLDNAPTYLVFFDLAGGDPVRLMGPLAGTLAAISAGAVFMGAGTYIGNAPNFMVYAIARSAGIRMPGFVGYLAWSGAILLPVMLLASLVFFR